MMKGIGYEKMAEEVISQILQKYFRISWDP